MERLDGNAHQQTKIGPLQEILLSNFFSQTNLEYPFQHQVGINKKSRKRISQEVIVTAGASKLVLQTNIAYGGFLKRPLRSSLYAVMR